MTRDATTGEKQSTVSLVSQTLMDATWLRVGGSTQKAISAFQQACGKEQAELMRFAIGYSSTLRDDAHGLALYLNIVVREAFRKSGAKFGKITPGKITRAWESAQEFVTSLMEHGRPAAAQHAEQTSEPAVFRYIVEAMDEPSDDRVDLTDDEFWHILRILLTVSDCMHDSRKTR